METPGHPSPAPATSDVNRTTEEVVTETTTEWTPLANPVPPHPTLSAKEERDIMKAEYYSTYDAMTGIRIAATLGGFFSLMVFLVVYKSRCRCRSSRKSGISEEELAEAVAKIEAEEKAAAEEGAAIMAAVAAAVQEQGGCLEDDDAPLEAYYTLMARSGFSRRTASFSMPRHSFASFSAPTPRASCGNCASSFRQRSLRQRRWGSGNRMPRRNRGKSLPGYATFGEKAAPNDAAALAAAVEAAAALTSHNSVSRNDDDSSCCYLEVPRRLSSVGSGSVSSYLEKRGSVVLLGLPPYPPPPPPRPRLASPPPSERVPASQKRRRKRRESSKSSSSGPSYPININVIQPTPDVSPRGSERQLDRPKKVIGDAPAAAARVLAPLASYGTGGSSSSAASSLSSDCCPPGGDFDARSVGSDSVFFDESSLAGSRRPSSIAPISSDSEEGVIPQSNLLTVPQGAGDHLWERAPPLKQTSNFLMVPSPNLRPNPAPPRTLPPPSPRPSGRWGVGNVDVGFPAGRRVSAPATQFAGKPSCDTISAQVSASPQLATTPETPPPALTSPSEDVRSTYLYRPFESSPIQPAERPSILHLDTVRTSFRSPTLSPHSKPSPVCLSPPISEPISFPMFGGSCEHLTVPDMGSRETLF